MLSGFREISKILEYHARHGRVCNAWQGMHGMDWRACCKMQMQTPSRCIIRKTSYKTMLTRKMRKAVLKRKTYLQTKKDNSQTNIRVAQDQENQKRYT
jgi:hypothetical protein